MSASQRAAGWCECRMYGGREWVCEEQGELSRLSEGDISLCRVSRVKGKGIQAGGSPNAAYFHYRMKARSIVLRYSAGRCFFI